VTNECGFGLESGCVRFHYNHDRLQTPETVSSTAVVVHLDQLLQQLLLSIEHYLGPTLPPGPTKHLGSLGSSTPTRTAFSELELLPVNWSSTLELHLTVIS
jgi:hypothetical protein